MTILLQNNTGELEDVQPANSRYGVGVNDTAREILRLRHLGLLHREIAAKVGVARQRVQQVCAQYGAPSPPHPPRSKAEIPERPRKRPGTWKERVLATAGDGPGFTRLRKAAAYEAVRRAIKSGKLVRPTECSRCCASFPKAEIHAHHEDYSRPLDVLWLCAGCHSTVHSIKRIPGWAKL